MMSTVAVPTPAPFQRQPEQARHDRRLVRRYLLESVLRLNAGVMLGLALLILAPLAGLSYHSGLYAVLPLPASPLTFPVILYTLLVPVFNLTLCALLMAQRNLAALRGQGRPLTREWMSSRSAASMVSPFDPLTTFELCAEVLSGVALGTALGYRAQAAFEQHPFQGRIVLGAWRPFRLCRSVDIRIKGEQIFIRSRFSLAYFLVQQGEAWHAVQIISEHLHIQLQLRDRALKAAARERELERTALQARLSALQAQVEPHFLFNTLANLKYLIRTDASAAQQMLDHLVGYLQNAMPDMRSVSSTLERELALARAYLSIMQIRIGLRLRFHIDADASLLALPFPPAMLISLVENAVKHGLERATRPGEIAIRAELRGASLCVLVRDDGAGLAGDMGQGFGLANIHERLQLLYGERAALSVAAAPGGGVDAMLAIPLAAKE
jgi:signal transduction histidine kinase